VGQFLLYGIEIAVAGSVAFALGPLVGRSAAAGIAGAVLFGGYLVDSFSGVLPLMEALRPLSWFAFTAHHRPLAGAWDWPPLVLLAAVGILLLAAGTLAFERRDLASTIRLPIPGLPRATLGTREPVGRSFGDRLPAALAWGLGTALIGLIFSSSSTTFAAAMRSVPAFGQMLQLLFPGIDYTTPGGFLQIGVFSSGVVLFGLAAATAVSGWAADETTGRLEVVLAAPITRMGWALRSGLGTLAAAPLVAGMMALAVAAGATQVGGDILTPFVGTLVLGVYMLALTGVGIAVGGLVRPGLAATTVVILTVAFYLIELFATALDLPSWVLDLALSHHLGQPMVGSFDLVGLAACAVLAVGGLLVGAWGLRRRDLRG
jgi:ABC-2 type transport system permease protein